ncbi:MAG: FecR domain-containing protein [Elusimicrobia bacterium]|nr:FecR domain-containing protein [Elusimicrobiota bacterium]
MFPLPLLVALAFPALAGIDIRSAEGGVQVFLPSLGDWRPVSKVPYGLRPGDRVRLQPKSQARLVFEDGSTVTASEDAAFHLRADDERGAAIELERGRIHAWVRRFHDRRFEVQAAGIRVFLREDTASISVAPRKVVVAEVHQGLAEVQPSAGPPIQVPEGHRLEVSPGKAPGLPVPLQEFQELQRRRSVPPGFGGKQERPPGRSSPTIGLPGPGEERPQPAPELGADSLGLDPEPTPAKPPDLGPESLGLDPALGADSLGVRELPEQPEPQLGLRSLGLADPGREKPAPKPKASRAPAEPQPKTPPISTDLSSEIRFSDYGVAPPKPAPAKARKPPAKKR